MERNLDVLALRDGGCDTQHPHQLVDVVPRKAAERPAVHDDVRGVEGVHQGVRTVLRRD